MSLRISYDNNTGIQLYRTEYNSTEKYERIWIIPDLEKTEEFPWSLVVVIIVLTGTGTVIMAVLIRTYKKNRR